MLRKKILFIFHDFDPINKNLLQMLNYAEKELVIDEVVFLYEKFSENENIFSKNEKLFLINQVLKENQKTYYKVFRNSFNKNDDDFSEKIFNLRRENEDALLYWLLPSNQFEFFKEHKEFNYLTSMINIVFYLFHENNDELFSNVLTKNKITYLQSQEKINDIHKPTIYEFNKSDFGDYILSHINQSIECAIKRIKILESPKRFSHSLRVANTIKKICDLLEIKDEKTIHDAYLVAIYHDIYKDFSPSKQLKIARQKLKIEKFPSWKVLHGPVGAWYMKTKYYFENEDILNAISEHTIPSEKPSLLTKLIYLADHLELEKKNDFTDDEYSDYWNLINEKKLDEAFNLLKTKTWKEHQEENIVSEN